MASVWGELKRRNVVKVAVAYAIVGWILVEVSSTVLPIFEAPDWIVQVFTFFVILGFPLALILSWAYEITPEGIKLERDVATAESITHVTGRKLDFAIIGLLLVAVVFLVVNYVLVDSEQAAVVQETITPAVEPEAESSVPVVVEEQSAVLPNSVAVLPFRNDSPDPDNAYYASGIHEEILNQLVKLSALNVIARTSVEQYRNTEKSIPEIASELNVETVMEGSVRYADGQIRITTQLNDGVTGAHLWSETYTRDFKDIFAIESDVAMNVANALEAEFSLEEQASIEKIPTDSPAAYALYLQQLDLRGINNVPSAVQLLDRALELDPEFAVAYGLKALRLVNRGRIDPAVQADRARLAQEAAEQALALDPNLASAHAALAALHAANWRWAEAERAYERAYQLNPNDTDVLDAYGSFRRDVGQYADAVTLFERVAELNPNAERNQLGISYRYAKNYDAAAAAFRQALDVSPASAQVYMHLAITEISRGNADEGLRQLTTAEQLWGDNTPSNRIAQIALAYAQLNHPQDVERLFDELQEIARASDDSVGDDVWAMIYLALGDYDQALQRLEVLVNDLTVNVWLMGQIKANDFSDPVLEEPRWQEIRDRLGAL